MKTFSALHSPRVAVIGGGPAGIAAAKALLEEGLTPVLLEQSGALGGQWSQGASHSGIWPAMHANSPAVTMAFSDYEYPAGTPMFPANQQVLAYLRDYARHYGVDEYVRLHTRVTRLSLAPGGGYLVSTVRPDGEQRTEAFSHVVVASGRYNRPHLPDLPGLAEFGGRVLHSFAYRGREAFRGQRVLVVGNSISGLEIASDLALNPDTTVLSSSRKPRYIVKKITDGQPSEQAVFTRFAAYLGQVLTPQESAEGLKQLVLKSFGNPADYGGLRPADNILEAGISQCQDYLDQVAAGRITPLGGVAAFTPTGARLTDGREVAADVVMLATGYDLHLPFLTDELRRTLNANASTLDLHHFTFHPELPNFACLGLFPQIGAYFPVVELQGRWIAATWSGARPLPTPAQMAAGLAEYRQFRQVRQEITSHEALEMLAHDLGVAPSVEKYPDLARELFFGLLVPAQFRLEGHGARANARTRFVHDTRLYSRGRATALTPEQLGGLQMLAARLPQHPALHRLVEQLQPELVA